MASALCKMSVQGIRSFGPEDKDKGIIEFFSPLTLILGANGTGKTTIIECLKYMATGEMPPGSNRGGAFIHDPKIAHEREVKAQIRLQFRDVKGEICVAQRSLNATQQVKNVTIKTLDGVITRKLKDGSKQSINKRCADMDKEMVALLGVSKPVLENVIFCHQEDSNWPLSEGKALKQKFDDIFASTRYVKALEAVRNQKKAQAQVISESKVEVKHLKHNKEKAATIRCDLEDRESRYNASKESVQKINEKLEPITEKIEMIDKRLGDLFKMETNIQKLLSEKGQMEKQVTELVEQIGDEYIGTSDELKDTLEKFEVQVQKKQQHLNENIVEQSSFEDKINKINHKKSDLTLNQGKLQQEAERHKSNINKRNELVLELSEKYELPDHGQTIDEESVTNFFEAMKENANQILTIAKKTKCTYEEREEKVEKEMDKQKNMKTALETEQKMKHEQMVKNKGVVRNINKELSRVEASAEKLTDIELELNRKEMSHNTTESAVNVNSLKAAISDFQREKTSLDAKLKDLDVIIGKMTRDAKTQSEVDVFRKDKNNKEDQIRQLKAKNEDTVCQLLGSFPDEGLFRKLDTYVLKEVDTAKKCQKQLQELRAKIATYEANKQNFSEHLRRKEAELSEKIESVEAICFSQSLQESVQKVKKEIIEEEDRKTKAGGMQYLYERFRDKLQEKANPDCPLCHRRLGQEDAVMELIEELSHKISRFPSKMIEVDKKLKNLKLQHEKMLLLGPVQDEILRLEKEIPDLKAKIKEVLEMTELKTLEISEQEDILEEAQNNERLAKDVQADAKLIDAISKDIRELTKKIGMSSSRLSGEDCRKSIDEVQSEREEILLKLKINDSSLDNKREQLNNYTEKIQREKAAINELKAEKLKIENDLQHRKRNEEQKEQLELLNVTLESEIEEAKEKIIPLQEKLSELESEKDAISSEKERKWEADKQQIGRIKDDINRTKTIHDEILQYKHEGKDQKLKKSLQEMEQIKLEVDKISKSKDKVVEAITLLRKDIDQQSTRLRELQDNIKLRDKRNEISKILEEISVLQSKLKGLSTKNLQSERKELITQNSELMKEKHQLEGRKQGLEDEIRRLKKELKDDMFRDAEKKYRDQIINLRTNELASQDLDKYYRALDMAIMNYHSKKMSDINKIIRELWRNTYKGNDIETIEIRSDQEDKAATGGCDKRRTYQYRVVMIKGDVAIDMRGRCSAGQKVLTSILIRLALAETFCLNCGVFALDEPTTNLDRENIESLAYALVEIIKARKMQSNFQLVVITHDEDFVELLGRSEYFDDFFKVRKDQFGCSQLVKARVQDLYTR